jgi:anti-sigma regulatory factor (Ser/Thr protein kinase)
MVNRCALAPRTMFLALISEPQAPGLARAEVVKACLAWGLGEEEFLEIVGLLTSELVTNTLSVALAQTIEVRAESRENCLVLDVWDPSNTLLDSHAERPMPGVLEESGRGIPLVEMLASLWYQRPARTRPGKHLIAHVPHHKICGCVEELP